MAPLKTLIIGSGPAGYTAAIYLLRRFKPVLYAGMEPGGQLTTTTEVDNFPGYPKGIDGPQMMVELQQQTERFGTRVRIGHINKVELSSEIGRVHKAYVEGGEVIEAQTVIISTGASANIWASPVSSVCVGVGFRPVQFVMAFSTKDKM